MDSEKKQALMMMVLAAMCGMTGNFFLSTVGMICGGLHYCNNRSAPDLMFMLSFTTAVMALMYLFSVISFGTLMLFIDPARVCGASSSLMKQVTGPKVALPASAGIWNMTETAKGHIAYHAQGSPSAVKGLTQVNALVCGDNGSTFLLGLGFGALLFALCVVTPLIALALRFVKQARRDGGCNECGPAPTIFVVRDANGQYQQVDESQVYPQHMYPPHGGAYAQAYPQQAFHPQQGPHMGEQFVRVPTGGVVHTNVPVAVPVSQPSSVTVARADPIPNANTMPGPLPVSAAPTASGDAARPAASSASGASGGAHPVGTPVKP